MATQEIIYNTLATTPSDHLSPDGQLALPLNLLYQDGALRPIPQPTEVMKLADGEQLLYIHEVGGKTNYIVHNPLIKAYISIDKDTKQRTRFATSDEGLTHFNAIGNTLIAFSKAVGMHYFLYKEEEYKDLGHQIPHLPLSFGLVGQPKLFSKDSTEKKTIQINLPEEHQENLKEFSERNKAFITEIILAKVNKFIAEETVNKGRFCFPFLVRYALRLYDGTLTAHSAPILMSPSTKTCPIVFHKNHSIVLRNQPYRGADFDIFLMSATPDYQVLCSHTDLEHIKNSWGDIVTSVEIYISKPIYSIDTNGTCDRLTHGMEDTTFIGAIDGDKLGLHRWQAERRQQYAEWKYRDIYSEFLSLSEDIPSSSLKLPSKKAEQIKEDIQNTATFYHIKSIPLQELATGSRKEIEIPKDYLQSLLAREMLTHDYLANERIIAEHSFVYNARLNLSGVKRKPFQGYTAQSMLAYTNTHIEVKRTSDTRQLVIDTEKDHYQINVEVIENGHNYIVTATNTLLELKPFFTDGSQRVSEWGTYLYYPNPHATQMTIYNKKSCITIPLKPHPFLHGACAVLAYGEERRHTPMGTMKPIISDNNTLIPLPNKIYTSEANNPFAFPVTGINTIATSKIHRLASATKALSQGQFGQFPLYAFTDDGVWALEVTEKGTYRTKQPITRDVCISPESVTQIDNAVLFATERGIMLLSGSQAICITESIDHDHPQQITSLPNAEILVTLYNKLHAEAVHALTTKQMALLPLREYVTNCRIAYDYPHQRIFVYNPTQRYAYVYALQDKTWGIIASNMEQSVNAYPEALVVDKAGAVLDLTKTNKSIIPILLMTRPIRLNSSHEFKTIEAIIQRSKTSRDALTQVLYGSNDLEHWQMVWSSDSVYMRGMRGTPYKYFVIVVMGALPAKSYLLSATVDYKNKWGNKIR